MGNNPLGWTLAEFESWAEALGHESYRARQAAEWIFKKGVTDPEAMTTLPRELRQSLDRDYTASLPVLADSSVSSDGTEKFLLELSDKEHVEMVLIPEGRRNTLCFSTQAGCAVGCLFCETGRGGLSRDLEPEEIVGQVIIARGLLGTEKKLSNLVAMGMGEPLLNFDNVVKALRIITSPWGLSITQRRVTLSTAGIVPKIAALKEYFPALNLAVSLNAPDRELRFRIMPGTRPWPVEQLLASLDKLPGKSRHPLTFEYVLLKGLNDSPAQARRLSRLLKGRKAQVNLILVNAVSGSGFSPPQPEAVEEFAGILMASGIKVIKRKSRGADIEAACGQLRARKN